MKEEIIRAIRDMGISFDLITHPPAHSMDECRRPAERLGAVMPANLLLRPRRHETYYLLVCAPEARLYTSSVSRQVSSPRLGFASAEEMERVLLCRPGSASALELVYPQAREVTLLMDRALMEADRLAFHPGENDASLAMSREDFLTIFLPRVGKSPIWVDMEVES